VVNEVVIFPSLAVGAPGIDTIRSFLARRRARGVIIGLRGGRSIRPALASKHHGEMRKS